MGFGTSDVDVVISTPLRTAIGTFGGSLKDVPATDLGATVGKEVLSRSGIEGDQVDQVIVGNILSAGQGMNPGRQVGIKSGLPVEVPGMTLNRMCGSGLQAISLARRRRSPSATPTWSSPAASRTWTRRRSSWPRAATATGWGCRTPRSTTTWSTTACGTSSTTTTWA